MRAVGRPLVVVALASTLFLAALGLLAARASEDGARARLSRMRDAADHLDRLALLARASAIPNFDPLADARIALRRLRAELPAPADDDEKAAMAVVDERLQQKLVLVEDIKSAVALWKSSALFIVVAVKEANEAAERDPSQRADAEALEQIAFAKLARADAADRLAPFQERVVLERWDELRPELNRLFRHVSTVHTRAKELDKMVNALVAVDLRGAIDAVHARDVVVDARILFAAAAALALAVSYAVFRLSRASRAARRFVPDGLVELLGKKSVDEVQDGDHRLEHLPILFSDIRGYSSLTNGLAAKESFHFINAYMAAMTPAIHGNHGFVNQYLGDGIMALFGREKVRADDAVRAGVAMFERLAALNAARAARDEKPIRIGVGAHYGPVMVRAIGVEGRTDCGVVGESVNLAARVEAETKINGCVFLITDDLRHALDAPDAFALRLVDRPRVKGAKGRVDLYEVLDAETPERRAARLAARKRLEEGIHLYFDRDLPAAKQAFEECAAAVPDDGVPRMFLERIAREQRGPSGPEPPDGAVLAA